jgi:pimeloyl-ACP methyl ester carboxylesterase
VNFAAYSDNEVEGDTYECGIVVVPEDYSKPDGRTLELVYLRLFSTDGSPAPDPLLYLSGGPGGSAIHEMAPGSANFLLQNMQHIRAGRDIVVYDQRGAGLSNPLLCGPVQAAIGAGIELLPELAEDVRMIEESGDFPQQIFHVAVCAGGYTAAGVDLTQYNSIASSHDMAALMDALGYAQYNLYGTSYGTKLAQVAVRETPERIRTIITDGTTPITGAVAASSGIEGQEQYVRIFEQCAADPACNAAYPDLPTRFDALLDRLAEAPILLEEPIHLSGLIALQFPDLAFPAVDAHLFQHVKDINNLIPYHYLATLGIPALTGQVPAMIAAAEANDIDALRAIFESAPSFGAAAPAVPVTEFADEQAMLPDNQYVAPSIEVLLAEAQKAATVTLADTPQKQWVALVINDLSTRLQGGEAQVEILPDLVEFAFLPAKGRDAQILVDFANEQMPEALAAQLNALAEGMTVRDVRATMWHIEEVAAAMSFVGEEVTGMHELVLYAVNCPESVVFHSQADVDAAMAAAEFPQLDEFEAYSWPLFAAACGFFPKTETIDASFLEPVRSDVPALIIQGAMDIQTPLSGARELAGYLTNSQMVEFNSEGHVVASKTGDCPGTISAQFLDDPLGDLDVSCAEEFVIDFALPE